MLHSGFVGAYGRADGFGGSQRPKPSSLATAARQSKLAATSAFHAPLPSHPRSSLAAAAAAAAYGAPNHLNERNPSSLPMRLGSSPTSVDASIALFGGDGLSHMPAHHHRHQRQQAVGLAVHRTFQPVSFEHLHGAHVTTPLKAAAAKDIQARPRDVALCLPCEPAAAAVAPTPVRPTARNADSAKVNKAQGSHGRRSSTRGPGIAAGDGGERPSGGGDGRPTPQNLKDNPERQAKVKTEMCRYYEEGKKCPYGIHCNYAHGKHELRFRHTTLHLMESSGQIAYANTYRARPCMTWVSTGACPFGRRCAAIHDPSISAPLDRAWLPAASAKTNATVIVDRLAAHRDNAVHQENPLIAQSIWENCRPSQCGRVVEERVGRASSNDNSGRKSTLDVQQEFSDTYSLVCNIGVPAFAGGSVRSSTAKKLSSLQKLCIVSLMHTSGDAAELHRDYVYAPTHSLHSELCTVLQARCFLLLDVNFNTDAAHLSPDDIVKEISLDEYRTRTTPWSNFGHGYDPSKCVMVHEAAFAPKGDHSANLSIWFDALPIKLEQSQIKRSRKLKQKKKTQAQARSGYTRPNANGALISRTSFADFPGSPPDIEPFVPMLPAEDTDDANALIMAILKHRIDSILLHNCSFVDEEQKKELRVRAKKIQKAFLDMAKIHEKWTWPKREGMDRITAITKAPPGNIMPYIPVKRDEKSPCLRAWRAFAVNIHTNHSSDDDTKRLSVFLSFSDSSPGAELPHIVSNVGGWWKAGLGNSPKKDATWKEILLGQPEDGKWEAALRIYNKQRAESVDDTINNARNIPLSTIPFVQA